MTDYKLPLLYDSFIYMIIFFKIMFILLKFIVAYLNITNDERFTNVLNMEQYIDFITLLLIYSLILYIFVPWKHIDAIIIRKHERIILFSAGLIGIINLNWSLIS
jgi:hypothetical protein